MTPAGVPPQGGLGGRGQRMGPGVTLRAAVRVAGGFVLLALIVDRVDSASLVAGLAGIHPGWVLAALAVSVGQLLLLALRWRFTAARLRVPISFRDAFREYYRGVFLNQLLPGGVWGDVSRAWNQGQAQQDRGRPLRGGTAMRGVLLERGSAQAVMILAALGSMAALPLAFPQAGLGPETTGGRMAVTALILLGGGGTLLLLGLRGGRRRAPLGLRPAGGSATSGAPASWGRRLQRETLRSVLAPGAARFQLWTGLILVASYVGVFLLAARAVGVETPIWQLALLAPPVLLAMLIPIGVAGWGVREGAAAALWGVVGLPPSDGVLVSVAYGLLVLLGALPGALTFLRRVRFQPRTPGAGSPPS